MEALKDLMKYMKGYQHVSDFQRFCGVDIVELDSLVHKNGDVPNGTTKEHGEMENTNSLTNGHTNGSSQNGVKHRHANGHVSNHESNGGPSESVKKNGSFKNGICNPDTDETKLAYKINNKLVNYIFVFGAGLGSELFYIIFFPFMIWNVNSRLCRCMLLIWYPLMYIGQFLKDLIRWPRPGPPAVRLEGKRFEMEYGMPSTHTIVGTCIPFSILVLASKSYEFPFYVGLIIAISWTCLVACSRVYLGMHTVMDCAVGITMTAAALPCMLSVVEQYDYFQVTNPYAPLITLLIPLLACFYYPKPEVWSITRGDTSNIVSIGSCVGVATWMNYQLGWMSETVPPTSLQPLPAVTMDWVTTSLIRTVIGVAVLASSRVLTKIVFLKLVCTCAGVDTKDIPRQRELGLEVPVRWLTIGGLAINTAFTMPIVFNMFGLNRAGYYSEVWL